MKAFPFLYLMTAPAGLIPWLFLREYTVSHIYYPMDPQDNR